MVQFDGPSGPVEECSEDNNFQCPDGNCIPKVLLCDAHKDCSDGADESQCDSGPVDECGEDNYFQCPDGNCIPETFLCDAHKDCSDGADESQCDWYCNDCQNDGTCLKVRTDDVVVFCICKPQWTGDYCEVPVAPLCETNQCLNGGVCHYLGDKVVCSCAVGWKGLVCEEPDETVGHCSHLQFQCDDGRCIFSRFRCNGAGDCLDSSDEVNCTSIVPSWCAGKYDFHCEADDSCIDIKHKCDGPLDCSDGQDEADCGFRGSDNSSEGTDNYIYISTSYQTVTFTIVCSIVTLVVIIACGVAIHQYRRRLRYRYQLAMAITRRRNRPRSNIYVPPPCLSNLEPQIDRNADPDQTHVYIRYSINNGVQIISLGDDHLSSPSSTTNQSSLISNEDAPPSYWDVVQTDENAENTQNRQSVSSSTLDECPDDGNDSPPPPYPACKVNT
ncbi:uncharacterized protein LOC102809575 [Saccoglossus kowalevskii]|uniref:Low-density lipoprotein receptor-related protein 2-like n=1 Tax=Saccoglossus kowalevskii TaxID=10224 RepID=A0ABM0MNY5_SACKO|nr:PREDICTED: low-density lipoprotein receptor-related protein 2-like [Saccoglossus kowalevskii]